MEPDKKVNGAMVGLIIIILILVVGGIYIWQQSREAAPVDNVGTEGEVMSEEELEALENEVNTLETDIGVDVESVE